MQTPDCYSIPLTDWREVYDRVNEITGLVESYVWNGLNECDPDLIEGITQTVRERWENLMSDHPTKNWLLRIIRHDLSSPLNVMVTRLHLVARQQRREPNSTDLFRFKIILPILISTIRDAIGAALFYTNEKLPIHNVELSYLLGDSFLPSQKTALQFRCNPQRRTEKGVKVYIHKATVATLFRNIRNNAETRGNATVIEIYIEDNGCKVKISISDDGRGIPLEILSHIFEPGFSGSNGDGIGIANAPQRLAHMGADIEAFAADGLPNCAGARGARFDVSLLKSAPSTESRMIAPSVQPSL